MFTNMKLLCACITLLAIYLPVKTAQSNELQNTIVALDKALFDAFNACDLETWRQYLADDIEFYQDNDNVTMNRDQLEPSFVDRCGKDNQSNLRRELVQESIEVHPIQGFGAVQFGTHQFWVGATKQESQLAATPKFVHLWRNNEGVWQITRVISYGH
jgi:ketosteroid isomerase-like protein